MKKQYYLLGALVYMLVRVNVKTEYDDLIKQISHEHGNNPHLIKAIIKRESNFRPKAHNTRGEDSRGLGQINAPTASALGVSDLDRLFDPAYNIEIMNKLMDDLKKRYDNILAIISAYNAGRPLMSEDTGKYLNSVYVFDVFSSYLAYSIFDI